MTQVYKTTVGNAILDNTYDTLLGASPTCDVRSGSAAGPDNAAGGTLGVNIAAPATAFSAAASKSKSKTGSWTGVAVAVITAAHYRLKKSDTTAFEEGTVALSSADMLVDNTSMTVGQNVSITAFNRTV